MTFALMRLLHRWSWWRHLLAVQKSPALFQIMPISTMDLASLLYICRAVERPPLLLSYGFLLTVPMISAIPSICTIGRVDFLIIQIFL
jgi:hypothetical protein